MPALRMLLMMDARVLVLLGAFVVGFLIVGRWVDNVVAQLFLGTFMGVAIMVVVACLLMGVAFAGCLFMNGGHMDFK